MHFVFVLAVLSPIIATFTAGRTSEDEEFCLHRVSYGEAKFSGKLIQEVAKKDGKNLIISPLSTFLVLALASFAGRGRTESVLRTALGLPSCKECKKYGLQALVEDFKSYEAMQLSVANVAFISNDFRLTSEFFNTSVNVFNSRVQQPWFSNPPADVSFVIKIWCQSKTANHVNSVIHPADLNNNTNLVLVNAVYYNAKWQIPFDTNNTIAHTFYREGTTEISLQTMVAKRVVYFGEYSEANSAFIELPILSKDATHNMSMFVILPNDRNGLAFLEANFHKINLGLLRSKAKTVETNIRLPKFRITNEIELSQPLTQMNMGELFDPNRADFAKMCANPSGAPFSRNPRIFVDKIAQGAFIEINEEGGKASTAAGVIPMMTGTRDFFADHPFYAIIATTGNNPVNVFTTRFTGHD
ncbi:serine protease inhibitor 3/4-like [Venturia canescens]|uniref:serine protease inhibitor 3/4-like n=1 Tax=Venturia canescens TaxID=32260 RepID=UPI001C9C9EEA|nr:serine protease inhibitor 3/4-like [Venturia canescens]